MWLGDEQVDALRHQHIPEDHEPVAAAKPLERDGKVPTQSFFEQERLTAVATESEGVVIAVRVISLERTRHGGSLSPIQSHPWPKASHGWGTRLR